MSNTINYRLTQTASVVLLWFGSVFTYIDHGCAVDLLEHHDFHVPNCCIANSIDLYISRVAYCISISVISILQPSDHYILIQ